MRRPGRIALGAGTAALCLTLAACGSSSSGGSPTPTGSTGGNTSSNNSDPSEGVTANSITIEGDIVKTSSVGYSQKLADLGAKAAFTAANKAGGVNGRQIKYLGSVDNHLDPAQDLPTVQKIVTQDKAFAVVPMVSPVLSQGGNYLITNKVPFIGWGITPSFCNNDVAFGFSGCLVPTESTDKLATTPAGLMDKLLGSSDGTGHTVSMISEDSTAGKFGISVSQAAFVADKWNVLYAKSTIPSAQATTDFTPYAQALLKGNPDVIYLVNTAPNVIGLEAALVNAGYKGPILNAVTYDPTYLESAQSKAALQNAYVFIQYGGLTADNAGNKAMLAAVEAVDPSQKVLTQDIAIGYYSAQIFLDMLKKTGANVTRDTFLAAANNNYSFQIPGALKIAFPDGHTSAGACGSLQQVQGANYVQKVPLTCFPTTTLAVLKQ